MLRSEVQDRFSAPAPEPPILGPAPPQVVMLSSAGVTRVAWDAEKAAKLAGAADIPIIRLNPGGILGKKCEAEQMLRDSGVPYTIVRPTGLKDNWGPGRSVLSQGDVAVGRTDPGDLADVLVALVGQEASQGKTFEMLTLKGYPAPRDGLEAALQSLRPDSAGPPPAAQVESAYQVLQQLLPGEEQDATKLEMGRSYEEVDAGKVTSRAPQADATAREKAVAAAAVAAITGDGKDSTAPLSLQQIWSNLA